MFLKEFKEFAVKGNMLDLAVGVVIGGAFGQIVTSLVNDIMMPLLGLLIGGFDLTALAISYGEASLQYGAFLQSVIDFLIISISIFLVVKGINKFRRTREATPPPPPAPSKSEELLSEIRDLLRASSRR